MRRNRISERDVDALLHGSVPRGDDELRILANTVDAIRNVCSDRAPRPSAELAARLHLGNEAAVSASAGGLLMRSTSTTPPQADAAAVSKRGFTRMFISWVTGLGLAAKIALGATTAAAVGIGAGAAGVLPAPAQDAFEQVVGSDAGDPEGTLPEQPAPAPAEPGTDEPVEPVAPSDPSDDAEQPPVAEEPAQPEDPAVDEKPATHGEEVRVVAQDKTDDGRPHGHSVREVASKNGSEQRADKGDTEGTEETEEQADAGAEAGTETKVDGSVKIHGKVKVQTGKG